MKLQFSMDKTTNIEEISPIQQMEDIPGMMTREEAEEEKRASLMTDSDLDPVTDPGPTTDQSLQTEEETMKMGAKLHIMHAINGTYKIQK